MGTRADFYIGRGENAEWLGSIAFDGYPSRIDKHILNAKAEGDFRLVVSEFLQSRNDATLPDDGWPWPWDDSQSTDYSYSFDNGKAWQCCFGYFWWPATELLPNEDDRPDLWRTENTEFPDMSSRRNMPELGSSRSGLMVIGIKR